MITSNWFLKTCLSLNIHKRVYIAYSGGIDSSVLLQLFSSVYKKLNIKIKAIHINHSYSNKSLEWLYFCQKQCNNYSIPLITWNIKPRSINIEEYFRIKRLTFFSKIMMKNSTLALAHHNNDIIETFFLNLFRGTGLKGLNSIKMYSKIKNINIVRPLIKIQKDDIKNYAINNKINYIIDFSNFKFFANRNILRYIVFPLINKNWIGFEKKINNFILIYNHVYDAIYYKYLYFLKTKGYSKNILLINYLLSLPLYFRYEVFKLWLNANNYKTPHLSHLNEINKLLNSNIDIITYINLDKYIIKKYKNYLYIEKKIQFTDNKYFTCIKKNIYIKRINIFKINKYKNRLKKIYYKNNIFLTYTYKKQLLVSTY